MISTGEKLKRAREQKGRSLSEIAESTKIGRRYLEAIERGDPEDLPGEVFAKGYIRTYAAEVGLDPDRLLDQYQKETSPAEEPTVERSDPVVREMSRILDRDGGSRSATKLALALVALGVVVGGIALGYRFWPGATTPPEPIVREPVTREPIVAETRPVEPEPLPEPVAVETPEPAEPPVAAAVESPAPPPAVESEPQIVAEPAITVPDHGVGTAIVNRQLVGVDEQFPAGTTVWFWTRVVGAEDGDTVRHVWSYEGRLIGEVELRLGGAHWRTQSRRELPATATGHWTVEARDSAGRVLARDEFTVVAPG